MTQKGGRKAINAKCETVAVLPIFREAYRRLTSETCAYNSELTERIGVACSARSSELSAIRTNAPWWDRNLSCLPIIALMLVKESSDLTLQRSCMVQLTH